MVTGQLVGATLLGLHALGRYGLRQIQHWNAAPPAPAAAGNAAAPTFAAPNPQPDTLSTLALARILQGAAGSRRQFQEIQPDIPPRFREQLAQAHQLASLRRLDEMLP